MSTKLDAVPTEWKVQRIQEFAECTAGGTPSTKVSDYWGGKFRWMNSSELHLKRVKDVKGRITESGLKESSARMLPRGCVLVGLAGQGKTRGTVAINLVPLSTNQSVAAILPNKSFVNEYLYHNLDYRYDELREISSGGGGRGGLNLSIIQSLEIPVPNLLEQETIAQILSDMDALLDGLDRLIAKKRYIKQAAMQQLLTGRTRLPGFTGEWELRQLGEFAEVRGGGVFPLAYQGARSGDFPFFKVSDMNTQGNEITLSHSRNWISESTRRILGNTVFQAESIVFAKIGAAIFLERRRLLSQDSCIDNNMMALTLTDKTYSLQFFYYVLLNTKFEKLVATTALPALSERQIKAIEVPVPTHHEQREIANVLTDMDAEISALEARRDKTQNLKRAMMQELLTGRTRLVKPEASRA